MHNDVITYYVNFSILTSSLLNLERGKYET